MQEVGKQVFKLAELNPAKYNPRKQLKPGDPEFERLCRSLKEFGYVEFILVNVRDGANTIIHGHQRWACLKHLGEESVECLTVDLDEPEEKALNIAMNKISGEWDLDKLKALLKDIDLSGLDATLTGFPEEELGGLIGDLDVDVTTEDGFDPFEGDRGAFLQEGDIVALGRHRLLVGSDLALLMNGAVADIIVTDPVVAIDQVEDAYPMLYQAFAAAHKHLSDDGSAYIWYTEPRGIEFLKAFEEAGFYLSGCCIWERSAEGGYPYRQSHDTCLFGWKAKGRHRWFADRKQTTVWEFPGVGVYGKPLALMAYPMRISSPKEAIVLDPFGGYGSVLMAAEQTGRTAYVCEADPWFASAIVRRYINWKDTTEDVEVTRSGEKIHAADLLEED